MNWLVGRGQAHFFESLDFLGRRDDGGTAKEYDVVFVVSWA